jgi:hypothetical protein
MNTPKLVATAVVLAVVPALVSFGCNKKEEEAPAPPSATPAATPPPPPPAAVAPPPTQAAPAQAAPLAKAAPRTDGGARGDAAVAVAPPGLPPMPSINPSQLPGIASNIISAVASALPTNLIPPPPPAPAGGDH